MKNKKKLTQVKIPTYTIIDMNKDVVKLIKKKRMNHERKQVPSVRPIIFIPSLALDSFSAEI